MSGGNERLNGAHALILLSGLPGAGKTTLARAIAQAIPAVVVETDAIRRSIAARPDYSSGESARVFGIAESRVREGLLTGHHVIFDATNLHTRDRRRFLRLAAELDATLVPVRVLAPEETIRERLSLPRDGYSEADIAVYELMRDRVRGFSVPAVVVDTRFDLAPSVEAIARLLTVML